LIASEDDGIVVRMGTVDWSSLPPSPWTDEELTRIARTAAEENRARRGYDLSFEELQRIMKTFSAEADAKRGYKRTPEETERQVYAYVFEARTREARRCAEQAWQPSEYRYTPPSGPLALREGTPETQLDRIERGLTATRVQLEALESRVDSFADHNIAIGAKLDELIVRVDTLTETVERIDLRVRRLEDGLRRIEARMDRLEQRMDRLDERVGHLEGRVDRLERSA
jgi:hypothetical protein